MNKAVLHDHLDGGLRASTAKELAIKDNYLPLINVDDIESFFNRESSESLEEYLEAFVHSLNFICLDSNARFIFLHVIIINIIITGFSSLCHQKGKK